MAIKRPGGGGGGYGPGPSAGGVRRSSPSTTAGARKIAVAKANKAAGVSSVTKRTSGINSTANRAVKDVAKRRIKGYGQAAGFVKKKASKEIKRERKQSGEWLYDKKYYGKKSVNAKMTKVPSKSRSGR